MRIVSRALARRPSVSPRWAIPMLALGMRAFPHGNSAANGARLARTQALDARRWASSTHRLVDPGAVTKVYNGKVENGEIRDDPAQRVALYFLDQLYEEIVEFDKVREEQLEKFKEEQRRRKEEAETAKAAAGTKSWFSALFGTDGKKVDSVNEKAERTRVKSAPNGLYIHGGPGSGKTFSMELFYHALPVEGKKRVHFHEFMLQVHRMLHSLQQRGLKSDSMIDHCVEALYNEGWVLCFDEFQVTDIADAMVIRRLFDALLDRGMVVIITSNRVPDELYKNGIQRNLFLPFIEDIKRLFKVINVQSDVDYRMFVLEKMNEKREANQLGAGGNSNGQEHAVYFVNSGKGLGQAAKFERLFETLSGKDIVHNSALRVQGRTLRVPQAASHDDVARFSFDDLCGKPLGAADYYAIASTFHTVFIDNVPQMKLNMINQMRRFIVLIDTLYDQKVAVVISAKAPMDELLDRTDVSSPAETIKKEEDLGEQDAAYVASDSNIDEIFAFDRTLSRLHEMNRKEYLLHARTKFQTSGPSPVRFLSQLDCTKMEVSREGPAMSTGDIRMLWDRYDRNSDGVIDKSELKKMLEDITLFKSGHRHVPEEVYQATRDAILLSNGQEASSKIRFEEFKSYFETFGLTTRG